MFKLPYGWHCRCECDKYNTYKKSFKNEITLLLNYILYFIKFAL